ncbi:MULTISPECIES: hypothetical protein [unclassified Streptomyces]|uniref:hypothetical protein n=1 Tax=unclassified Streptomyces TaxID=2593676 RepID=UPI000A5671FC|nr:MULTISPECIES: hypothetical protein [unclassified Streptomyces]
MSPSLSNDDAPAITGALEPTPGPSRRRSTTPRATESNLVAHARRELRILGEDPDTIRGLCKVVQAFADMGHSGGSAPHAIAYLERLLRFQPLTDLTDDPGEWIDRYAEGMTSTPLWQSRRNSEAFSTDGGKTYYLLSEQQAAGDIATTPLHHSKSVPQPGEVEKA